MGAWLGRVSPNDAWYGLSSRLLRTKPVGAMAPDDLTEPGPEGAGPEGAGPAGALPQVLSTADLVSLGVGSCVGTGMYVVAGLVAKATAGPGVILSFLFAAMASILSGVCYAEFGVRVPKTTGSAYTYSYVTVGEVVAFFIGWNLILEYLIGTAAGAAALSAMFDSLANHSISSYVTSHLGTLRGLGKGEATPPDLLALLIALLVTAILALGVRNSVALNNILNLLNLLSWAFMVLAGLFFLSARNWEDGNFLPYGWSGVMKGAATCFYAFIGFDIIATTGEEAQNPNSIPHAITASLITCLTAYVSVSVILTLMVPYQLIDSSAPLMEMFAAHGFLLGKYVVAAGAVAGLSVSLLGSLFPMPRVIYAMARDGLLFSFLSHVPARTRTPTVACAVSGAMASLLALLLSLRDLIEMMSIGTLLAYTLVSVCVLLLRYQPDDQQGGALHQEGEGEGAGPPGEDGAPPATDDRALIDDADGSYHGGGTEGEGDGGGFHTGHAPFLKRLLGGHYYTLRLRLGVAEAAARPTPASGRTVTRCALLLFAASFLLWAVVVLGVEQGAGLGAALWGLVAAGLALCVLGLLLAILRQPQSGRKLAYMAPGVPFVPAAAILVNSYLMVKLSPITWARFAVWCLIGLLIYGCYGVWHSSLELSARQQEAHASSYQRYDHLDPTHEGEGPYQGWSAHEGEGEGPYQGWSAPEERGLHYQNQNLYRDGEGAEPEEDGGEVYGYQSAAGCGLRGGGARGRTNHGFDAGEDEE